MEDEKNKKYALLILPHLVKAAQLRDTITYKQLGTKVGLFWRQVGTVLGYIRDRICAPRKLPKINAIVINEAKKLPGEGFLEGGRAGLTDEEYRQQYERLRNDVFRYSHWDELLHSLGLQPLGKTPEDLDKEARKHSEMLKRGKARGESPEHRMLKQYVAGNPKAIGIEKIESRDVEYDFVSEDTCDVVFGLGDAGYAVVEVKKGERGELVKGIYQAIKYRALMAAEKGKGQEYPVLAFLVAYEIPSDIEEFAGRFRIKCRSVTRSAVERNEL